jgi:pyruvate/2-oxoglutarate dehydrogenase complex dihydrolipoamide acyltransferase (E2) component
MPTNILMPALSPSMDKGNIANWLKKEGDRVKVGDVLAEIDTDKATMEYESEDNGILAKILAPAGAADILVNTIIAVLAVEGEDVNAVAASAENGSAGPSAKLSASPLSSPQTVGLGGVMAQAAKQPSGTVWAEWWRASLIIIWGTRPRHNSILSVAWRSRSSLVPSTPTSSVLISASARSSASPAPCLPGLSV